jgi:hypothetical protein
MARNGDFPCGPGLQLPKGPNNARYLESIMEHAFLSEVLQYCWFILPGPHPVEVIRPDVDAGGYDLVLEANGRVRHVQLKSCWQKAAGPKVLKINAQLRVHPDPCVVWIFWQVDPDCRLTLQYRYSEKANRHSQELEWPEPTPGEAIFKLKRRHFLPGYIEIPNLVPLLFEPPALPA